MQSTTFFSPKFLFTVVEEKKGTKTSQGRKQMPQDSSNQIRYVKSNALITTRNARHA